METETEKIGGCIIVIGATGQGKTPLIKKEISDSPKKNVVVFDPRHEYSEEFTLFRKFKYFKEHSLLIKQSFIVVEEATSFIGSYKDKEISEWMIASEHNNNIVFFVFHSIMDVPPYVTRHSKYAMLLRTGDAEEQIRKERPEYYPYLNQPRDVFNPVYIDLKPEPVIQ